MSAIYSIFTSPNHPPVENHLPTLIVTPHGRPQHVLYTYLHTNLNSENYLLTPSDAGDLCVAKLFPPSGPRGGGSSAHSHSSNASGNSNSVRCEASRNLKWSISNTGIQNPIYKLTLPNPEVPQQDQPLFQVSKPNPNATWWTLFYFTYAGHLIPPKRVEFGRIQKNSPESGGGTRVSITGKSDEEKAVWKTLGEGNEDMVEWIVLCAALQVLDDEIVQAAERAGLGLTAGPMGGKLRGGSPAGQPMHNLHPTGTQATHSMARGGAGPGGGGRGPSPRMPPQNLPPPQQMRPPPQQLPPQQMRPQQPPPPVPMPNSNGGPPPRRGASITQPQQGPPPPQQRSNYAPQPQQSLPPMQMGGGGYQMPPPSPGHRPQQYGSGPPPPHQQQGNYGPPSPGQGPGPGGYRSRSPNPINTSHPPPQQEQQYPNGQLSPYGNGSPPGNYSLPSDLRYQQQQSTPYSPNGAPPMRLPSPGPPSQQQHRLPPTTPVPQSQVLASRQPSTYKPGPPGGGYMSASNKLKQSVEAKKAQLGRG